MRSYPILLNHDHQNVIGMLGHDGVGEFAEDQRITREMMFNIFGGAAFKILEKYVDRDGAEYIKAFEIVEFSLTPAGNLDEFSRRVALSSDRLVAINASPKP